MTTEPRTRRIVTVMDLYTCDDDSMKTHILSEAWTHTVLWKCSLLTDTHTHTQRLQLFYCSVCETLQGRCGTRTVNQYGGQNETWVTLTPTQSFIKPRTEIQQTLLSFPLSHNCGGKPAPMSYLQELGNLIFYFFCKTLEESQSRHSVLLRDQEQREAASSQQEPPIRDRLSTTM